MQFQFLVLVCMKWHHSVSQSIMKVKYRRECHCLWLKERLSVVGRHDWKAVCAVWCFGVTLLPAMGLKYSNCRIKIIAIVI